MEYKTISKHAAGKVLKSDGFQISSEAKAAKKLDPSIIDGTLGTFYYEDGSFNTHNTVKEVFAELKDEEVYLYSTSDGGKDFHEAACNHMFKHVREYIEKEMFIKSIPTPGGTGALVSGSYNCLDPGETLLIPTPCWGPYIGIATHRGINVEKYFLFDGEGFNLKGFKEKAEAIIAKQGKLVFFLNDPCNNPTGYSMTEKELEDLILYLNSTKVPCVMIYDCAYMDMAVEGMFATREKLKVFTKADQNVLISICLSFSKTYFIYGQRLGAQIILSKNEQNVIDLFNAANFTARNTWSNCNKGMVSLVCAIDKNPEYVEKLNAEIQKVVDLLNERSSIFLKEAKEIGLVTYPYQSGFFITIPCANEDKVIEELKNRKIYLLPTANSVRVAICSLPVKDCYGLAKKIKDVIDFINK